MNNLNSEKRWGGKYGNDYTNRSRGGDPMIASRTGNLARCLSKSKGIKTSLEVGSNIGYNEIALSYLFPGIKMDVIEINSRAAEECSRIPNVNVHNCSVFDFETSRIFDLTLVNGVLIYIEDDRLKDVYDILYEKSRNYILIIEYYNPVPVKVNAGKPNEFIKRDFAGEMLDRYDDLDILDYGFIYHRDPNFPMDDFNWFLLQKNRKEES